MPLNTAQQQEEENTGTHNSLDAPQGIYAE
jgi:hypothetical protein